jgi:hypothetical protein
MSMTEELTVLEGQLVVPYWMQDRIYDPTAIAWSDHPELGVVMYTRTPGFSGDEDFMTQVVTLKDLDRRPGWVRISGNLTGKVYSGNTEMGPLYAEMNTSGDSLTKVLSVVLKPFITSSTWIPALIEDGRGWQVSTGVQGIEQEQVAAVAVYLKGRFDGKTNPIVLVTDQGLGTDLLKGGSLYGMAQYAPSVTPSILTNVVTVTNRRVVNSVIRQGFYATLVTDSKHHYSTGDLVRIVDWTAGSDINRVIRVTSVIDEHTFQVELPTSASSTKVFGGPDLCWVEQIIVDIHSGTMFLNTPVPAYEPANTAHVWLQPQRMNLLVNPRMEGPADEQLYGWKSNDATTQFSLFSYPVTNLPNFPLGAGYSEDNTSPIVVESNMFPIGIDNNFISIGLSVLANGTVRVGVVAWDFYYKTPTYLRLPDVEVHNLSPGEITGSAVRIEGTIPAMPGFVDYNLRVELIDYNPATPVLMIGKCLADPTEAQTTVFDGDTNDGLPGDFSWCGGPTSRTKQFSMWYNNRKNTEARLFGGLDPDGAYQDGLLEEWIPTDANVVPHWGAITGSPVKGWTGDFLYPVESVEGELTLEYPWQEFDQNLLPVYTFGLTDESGALLRDEQGAVLIAEYGEQTDDILLTEDGQPITDNNNSYLLVG